MLRSLFCISDENLGALLSGLLKKIMAFGGGHHGRPVGIEVLARSMLDMVRKVLASLELLTAMSARQVPGTASLAGMNTGL